MLLVTPSPKPYCPAMRRRMLVTVSVVLGCLVGAGTPAVAGGPQDPVGGETALGNRDGLQYLSETLAVGSSGHFGGNSEAAWISCGGHSSPWHPVSGGATISDSPAENHLTGLRAQDLDSPLETPDNTITDDWWDTTVSSVVGRTLTGYAICTKTTLTYVSRTIPDGASSARTGSAACPAGKRLVGGGGFIATTGSWINSSYPARNNTWKVRIHDVVNGLGGMAASATCRGKGGIDKVTKTRSGIAAADSGGATALCPGKKHVIGGGGKLSGPIGEAHLTASRPVDGADSDSTPDDGWKVTGYNVSGASKRLTAYALCVDSG